MFFSKGLIYRTYDVGAIKRFYQLMSDIPDLTLEWRKGRKVVDDAEDANLAVITRNGKTLFALSNVNDKGFINIAVAGEYEKEVLHAAAEADIVSGPHSFSTGIMCLCGYFLLMLLAVFSFEPAFRFFLYGCLLMLFGGLGLYAWALFKDGNETMRIASSVISMIGFVLLAPGSLLMFPLVLAINRQWLYVKTYRE